ncbi:MAG: M18 family aminopeptidase [Emergencia sp.]|nr:M18 family aminopeptidase [Emergencia sp.]
MYQEISRNLLAFLDASPSCFHAVKNMADTLESNGFTKLCEEEKWSLAPGGSYFVTRNDSSIIAFTIPAGGVSGFRIMASHSDSPTFKVKESPEITIENHYTRLNVERYGGMIYSAWLDRPLSVAGRIVVKDGDKFVTKLVNIDRDLLLIPNLAIHMNREINNGYKYNPQKDLLPLYSASPAKGSFMKMIAVAADVQPEDILGHDLFLYNRQQGTVWGASNEFISSAKLDDLQCAFASLQGFLQGKKEKYAAVHCVFDNEEVGSETKQGAASTFLNDTLTRICESLSMTREDYLVAIAKSFLVSADNAHAVHPAYADKADPTNRPYINEGIVIKYNGDQKYCTDAISSAMFKDLCKNCGVSIQTFANRSDMAGGSTLGNISTSQVALNSVDIGLPQLAMHSPYETGGIKDTADLIQVAAALFA